MIGVVVGSVRRTLWDQVPRDHRESDRDLRRRQSITGAVVVVGATVLSPSLQIEPGNDWFYRATLGLAPVTRMRVGVTSDAVPERAAPRRDHRARLAMSARRVASMPAS